MITAKDGHLAERLRRLRQHAMSMSDVARHHSKQIALETYDEVGFNYRMTDMQAAVGIAQLERLPILLETRHYLATRYTEPLQQTPWLVVPFVPDGSRHNYQSYMVRLVGDAAKDRDVIMQELLERNISTRRALMAIHRELPYRSAAREAALPITNLVTETAMIVPLFHQMTETEQDFVIDSLLEPRL